MLRLAVSSFSAIACMTLHPTWAQGASNVQWPRECISKRCDLFTVRNSTVRFITASDDSDSVPADMASPERSLEQTLCSKTVVVPPDVFKAVSGMFGVMGMQGSAANTDNTNRAPVLTPAEQTMLLFYNTVTEQTKNFTCE